MAVYQQLRDKEKAYADNIERALYAAIAMNEFEEYEQFTARRMQLDESVDVYLTELRKLAVLFDAVSDRTLVCALVSGLPAQVKQLLRVSS